MRRVTLLLVVTCCGFMTNAHALPADLSGDWQVRLLSCLPTEAECLKRRTNEIYTVHAPMNLHDRFPWFFGVAEYTLTFKHHVARPPAQHEPDMLVLGSIGSIDETYINDVFIQREGIYSTGSVVSAWNKVRVYHLPTGVLKEGDNRLRVRATVLDFKAGIHSGPLRLGDAQELLPASIGYQYLREYLFFGPPILTFVMVLVLLITAKYWQRDEGNLYLILASAGYILHCLYFVPVPFFRDYLFLLKLQWIGRIVSVVFTTTYFLSNFQIRTPAIHLAWIAIGVVLSAWVASAPSHAEFFATMRWQQWAFLTHLAFPFLYWRRMQQSPRREIYMQYAIVAPVVAALYLNDALVLAYVIGGTWLYHYMSMLNVMNFLSHYSFHLYLWRHEGKLEGRRDAEVTHLREKIDMAHDLHDAVGAELSQMVVLAQREPMAGTGEAMRELAASSLEKVRNFAHILKGEAEVAELPALMRHLEHRLKSLGRFEVLLIENPPQVRLLRAAQAQTAMKTAAQVPELSPMTRVHLERIFSEWSANVLRHARAARSLTLGWKVSANRLHLFFMQDASPYLWKGGAQKGGLKGIERRAREIGARVYCRPFGKGSLFLVVLRLENTHG
jgi:signal transduction histidine kinase